MKVYTATDIKNAIKTYYIEKSFRKAASKVGIPKSTINEWVQRIGHKIVDKRKGSKKPNRKRKIPEAEIKTMVLNLFDDSARKSVLEVHQKVREKYGGSMSTTRRAIKAAGLSRKRVSKILNPNTPEQHEKIKEFRKAIKVVPVEDILSLDEASFDSRMLPIYGYSLKGKRIREAITLISRDRQSLACGVSTEGVEDHYVVHGSLNKLRFIDFLKKILPHCKQNTLILDNVRFHKSNEVLELIESYGKKVIFVPPYSPQYNPIEHVFSSMKNCFRKMQENETELIPLSTERLDDFVHAYKACEQPTSWKKTFDHCLRKCLSDPLPDGQLL